MEHKGGVLMNLRHIFSQGSKKQTQFHDTRTKNDKQLLEFSRLLDFFPQKQRWEQQFINNRRPAEVQTRYPQQNTLWHWMALILFGLLTAASFTQQLWLVGFLIVASALIKGPGMILFGIVYSFLVSLFPPLGVLLSLIIFLLNVGSFTKNWRVTLVGMFFYLYPVITLAIRHFGHFDQPWVSFASVLTGLLLLHVFLTALYKKYGISRSVFWYLFSLPFMVLSAILPKKGTFKRWARVKK
ncbi:hypothetical protein IGI57_000597 [Enterococcus sp. DIV0213j]